jgi:hypothetical protein
MADVTHALSRVAACGAPPLLLDSAIPPAAAPASKLRTATPTRGTRFRGFL